MSRTITQLSTLAVTLRLSPPPKNVTESRQVLKALQKFGQVTAFKALRFPSATSTFTPTVHALFASATAASAVKIASPLHISHIEAVVIEDVGRWTGKEHEDYLARAESVVRDEDGGKELLTAIRASGTGFGLGDRRRGKGWEARATKDAEGGFAQTQNQQQ